METVTTLDARRRGIFPSPFQPGDSLIKEYQDADRIIFRLIKPSEVPMVKAVNKKGRTLLKAPPVSRTVVADAIRADRDAR